ncbi:MAG: hypothetical protein AAF600_09270 [Bacteroidota bacterium]
MKYALVFFLLNSSLLVQLSYSQSLYTPNGTIGVSINNNIGIGQLVRMEIYIYTENLQGTVTSSHLWS